MDPVSPIQPVVALGLLAAPPPARQWGSSLLLSAPHLLPTGVFHLGVPVEALFFVGNQLIATSHTGRIGVWNAVTKHWQVSPGQPGSLFPSV